MMRGEILDVTWMSVVRVMVGGMRLLQGWTVGGLHGEPRFAPQGLGVYLTPQVTWLVVLILHGATVAGSECPDLPLALEKTGQCLDPLSRPTNDTLVGQLTRQSWGPTCRVYNHSMVCVDKVAGQCAGVVRDLIESAADARRESLGRLCDDQRAFTKYLRHAKCYAKQKDKSLNCLADFNEDVNAISTDEYEEDDGSETVLCGVYAELILCVNRVIEQPCGSDAAKLIYDIVKSEVPREISTSCQPTPLPATAPPSANMTSSVRLSCLLSLTLLFVTRMLL